MFGGVTHNADIDVEATRSWWKFVLTHNATATMSVELPYDDTTV